MMTVSGIPLPYRNRIILHIHTPSGGSNHVGGQAQITGYPAKVIGFYSLTLPETSETNRAPEKG